MTRSALTLLPLACALFLSACAGKPELGAAPAELAKFKLGHVVVVAENATKAPISRDASPGEWQAAMTSAVKDRFGRLEGEDFYHFGIHIDGFAVAPPGVPLVVSPKSVLIISVTAFEDVEGGRKLNEDPKQLTVFESLSGETVIGSGLTRNKAQQMEALSFNAARAIQNWLLEHPQWFDENATPPVPPPRTDVN